MININFFVNEKGILLGFKIEGHAHQNQFGKDIICAAVSSAAYMTVNTVTEILKINADVSVNENGFMQLIVQEKDYNHYNDILQGFKLHMISLEEQYPQNIIVNYTEV